MQFLTNCFLCVLLFPHKTFYISFDYHMPSPLLSSSCSPSLFPLFFTHLSIYFLAALLPNLAAYHIPHWLCSPGPAMTVSFTRVSPMSSLSLWQSPPSSTWTCTQPQHWPTEERHDHVCVSRRSARPFPGENPSCSSWDMFTTALQESVTFKKNYCIHVYKDQLKWRLSLQIDRIH